MKLSRNDVGLLAAIAVSGAVGFAFFGPQRLVDATVTIETTTESSEAPLVLVDGAPFDGAIESIAPELIDRVEVLKGDAALAEFGPEASAGVVQIFTKKDTGAGS